MNKPNILVIMTDQHRADCLGCYEHPNVLSPHIDELAAEGIRFSCAYSACPSCVPARASFMTGMSPWHTGILGMGEGQKAMRDDYIHTLPGELSKAGYHTQLVGKMHFSPMRALNGFHNSVLDEHQDGTDYLTWFNENAPKGYRISPDSIEWNSYIGKPWNLPDYLHRTNWTVMESIKFLEHRDPNKPFFLCTSFISPHSPYNPPQFFWDMYYNAKLPKPFHSEWSESYKSHQDSNRIDAWCGQRTTEENHRARTGYYGAISHIDNELGALFRYMKKHGLWENTFIIFTSDHGDMLGDHNLWRKCYAYESASRIPLLMKFPKNIKSSSSQVCNKIVELRDIMPTVLDVARTDIPDTVDGQSLLPLCIGKNPQWREYIHGEHSASYSPDTDMQFISNGKRKYIWFARSGKEQFFDLEKDPEEQIDLHSNHGYNNELAYFRNLLLKELNLRDCNITDRNQLKVQTKPIISEYRDKLFENAQK